MVGFIAIILLIIALGLLQIFYPKKVILLGFRWFLNSKEDIGDNMVIISRIQGIIVTAIGIVCLVKFLLL